MTPAAMAATRTSPCTGVRAEGVKYCVVCHNPSSIDPSSGNTLDSRRWSTPFIPAQACPTWRASPSRESRFRPHPITTSTVMAGPSAISRQWCSRRTMPAATTARCPGRARTSAPVCHVTSDTNTRRRGTSVRRFGSRLRCLPRQRQFRDRGGHSAANIVANDSQCSTCHGPSSTIDNGSLAVVAAHTTGVDTAIKHFPVQHHQHRPGRGPGQTPVATISVTDPTNSNAPYPIGAAGGPFQQSSSALNLDLAWSTNMLGANGVNNVGSGSNPALPLTINFAARRQGPARRSRTVTVHSP